MNSGIAPKRVRRIGFMLASIHGGSTSNVWPEIRQAALRHRFQIFVFPGGRLSSANPDESMRNRIFDLVTSANLDGALCWASSLSGYAAEAEVERYLTTRVDLPFVTFGLKIGDHPVVDIDAYTGMKRLVFHLAKRHRCTRIAFIAGPLSHSSAQARHRAYRDAIRESGLCVDERLEHSDTPWTEGRSAMRTLLDDRGLMPGRHFDALCAASDLLLVEAARLLMERGYRIPLDLALGGCNDSAESNLLSPTYTTVRIPFGRQAAGAFRMLADVLDGGTPRDRTLGTSLVLRQSCGCLPETVVRAGRAIRSSRRIPGPAAQPGSGTESLYSRAARAGGFGREEARRLLVPLVGGFLAALGKKRNQEFLGALDRALDDRIARDRDLAPFQDVLSSLRSHCVPRQAEPESREEIESLLGQGRVLVSDAEKRMSNYRIWKEKTLDHKLNNLNSLLLCAKDFVSVVRISAGHLPRLGIPSGYFVLDDPDTGFMRFLGGFDSVRGGGFDENASFATQEGTVLAPGLLLPSDCILPGVGAFVVLPLQYESTKLGHVVLEIGEAEGSLFEELRAQFSSAMRGVLLFAQVDEARRRAEKAERMKTHFLAGISNELQEPIRAIGTTAARLLARPDMPCREEIGMIVRHSARQTRLTKNLLDLSLAQVDELGLSARLFDPGAFAKNFVHSSPIRAQERGWCGIDLRPLPDDLPAIRGDEGRISQALDILLDMLFRENGTSSVSMELEIHREGLVFSLRGVPVCTRAPDVRRLETLLDGSAVPVSTDLVRIDLELAARIALLHGGSIGSGTGPEGESLVRLCIPYPSLHESGRWDRMERSSPSLVRLSSPPPDCVRRVFGESEYPILGIESMTGPCPGPAENRVIYIDPSDTGQGTCAALRTLLEHPLGGRMSYYLPAAVVGNVSDGDAPSLSMLLERMLPAESAVSVLILGAGAPGEMDAGELDALLAAQDRRILHSTTPGEAEALSARTRPQLLVLIGRRKDLFAAAAGRPLLADIPLLCVAARFDDVDFCSAIADRPGTVVCNATPLLREVVRSTVERMLGTGDGAPSRSDALMVRTVLFLNRHYRDPITRWRLSEHVNASEDYLSRSFHRRMGVPLWEYLTRLRIGVALDTLRTTTKNVSEAAYEAGFQDQAYFCRVFRRITGTTPGTFRKTGTVDVRKVQ